MIPKDLYRNKISEMHPDMPTDTKEEVLNQVDELIHKYGVLRVMTIGEIVRKVMEDATQKGIC